jgi:hypothetical protein
MQQPSTSGPAQIHTKRGAYTTEHAQFEAGVVSFTGSMRRRDLLREYTYPERTRSHKLASGEWVEWR